MQNEQSHLKPGAMQRMFEVRVKGRLDNTWMDWFDGFELRRTSNGETILRGQAVDQAALMGVLNRLADLNLPLLSVNEIKEADEPFEEK